MAQTQFHLDVGPQKKLYLQRWQPNQPAKGRLIITHGVAEHSECYSHTAKSFSDAGYDVILWDLPGHGRSYGQRGFVSGFTEFYSALDKVYDYCHGLKDKLPLVLFGHSLGGLITFAYSIRYSEKDYQGLLLSSPAFGVKIKVPPIKDLAARLLHKVAPTIAIPHQINFSELSHDQEIIASYARDPLRHKKFSSPLYLGILETMEFVENRARLMKKPIFIQAAGNDMIVDTDSTKQIFADITADVKKMKTYPDFYHEIYNEVNRQQVVDDALEYLGELNS